jgi:hypothetical protein
LGSAAVTKLMMLRNIEVARANNKNGFMALLLGQRVEGIRNNARLSRASGSRQSCQLGVIAR